MVINDQDSIRQFRSSAPYINAHRGKTFVLMFGGEAIEHENFANIIHDIGLLSSLGIRLVLVHGARPQIDARVALRGIEGRGKEEKGRKEKKKREGGKEEEGEGREHIASLLPMVLPNSPMHIAQILVSSANLLVATPIRLLD